MSFLKKLTNLFKNDNKEEEKPNPPPSQPTPVSSTPQSSISVRTEERDVTTPVSQTKNPHLSDYEQSVINEAIKAGITSQNEKAMLLAQLSHESGGFKRFEESFNYSPERLLAVFPKYVKNLADAKTLVSQGHQAIANRVYGGRMGNGPQEGWTYRGRGPIQLTGKDNYRLYERITGLRLLAQPDIILNRQEGIIVSIAYWKNRTGLQAAARAGDVVQSTRLINGGTNGLEDRRRLFNHYLKVV